MAGTVNSVQGSERGLSGGGGEGGVWWRLGCVKAGNNEHTKQMKASPRHCEQQYLERLCCRRRGHHLRVCVLCCHVRNN